MSRVTKSYVKGRVEVVEALVRVRDYEGAHAEEDALHRAVLEAIATGATDGVQAKVLAREALRTTALDFERIPTILSCPEWSRMHYNAHCYLWTTNTHLMVAGELMADLGFRYITAVTWVKSQPGMGQYFRGQTEHMLFGVRGKGKHENVCTAHRYLPTLVLADHVRKAGGTRVHSAKPDVFRELVEKRSKGPFLELFARTQRAGWTAWGNRDELRAA